MDCNCTGHLTNHPGQVHCVSWNPKPYGGCADILALCGDENTTVWSNKDLRWAGTPVLTEPNYCFRSCSWHPSGTILAVGGADSKVTILEYDQKIGAMTQINILRSERDDEITSLAWNCRGSLLLCCTLNGSIHMIVKAGDEYKMLHAMPVPTLMKNASLSCARWSQKMENQFAVAGYRSILFFEVQVKNRSMQINLVHAIDSRDKSYHQGGVANIAFSSDHKLVSAGADKTLKVWSLEESRKRASSAVETQTLQLSHRFVQSLDEHRTSVLSTDWAKSLDPHKSLIASGCDQKTLCIYRYQKEGEKETWGTVVKKHQAHKGAINHLAWHYMDPQKLASASSDGSVKIWEVTATVEEASDSRDHHQLSRNQQ